MKENEIKRLIEKKSQATQTIFGYLYNRIEIMNNPLCCNDLFATICYNCTLLILKTIVENPIYMTTEFDVKKEYIPDFIEDFKNMSNIDLPNEFNNDEEIKRYEDVFKYR